MNLLRWRREPTEEEIIERHRFKGETPEMREFRAWRDATGRDEHKPSGKRIAQLCRCSHERDDEHQKVPGGDWPCLVCTCLRFVPDKVIVMEPRG